MGQAMIYPESEGEGVLGLQVVVGAALLLVCGLTVAGGAMLCCWRGKRRECEGEKHGAEVDAQHQPWYLQQQLQLAQEQRPQLFELATLPQQPVGQPPVGQQQRQVQYIEQYVQEQQFKQQYYVQQHHEGEGERSTNEISWKEFPAEEEEEGVEEEEGEDVKIREKPREPRGEVCIIIKTVSV